MTSVVQTPAPAGASRKPEAAERTKPGVLAKVWSALEYAGKRRACREMILMAERLEHTRPELAVQLRQAARHMLDG